MPSKINILDENTIRKIAAGEVIERPASVVKELVENSIDAGASRVEIEMQDGGKKLIRVSDNGMGMSGEEASLCIERHSTSKIKKFEDIYSAFTMGFRGEALPSIASVSVFEITTKEKGRSEGTRIKVSEERDKRVEPIGCAEGTSVLVKRLFYNVPARMKYLKASSTEASHVIDIVSKFILGYPEISFRLVHDGKEIMSSPGSGDSESAVLSVYGPEVAKHLTQISMDSDHVKLSGFVSVPSFTRVGRRDQSFFVNRRFVRNFLLSRSLEEAYRSLIPRDRNPIAVIFMDIDPKDIDVNIHPAKREIKFLKTQRVLDSLKTAVEDALKSAPGKEALPDRTDLYPGIEVLPSSFSDEQATFIDDKSELSSSGVTFPQDGNSKLMPIAQIFNTYIVSQNGSRLLIIDQHAAHERVLFDKMKSADFLVSQDLLIPETIDLAPAEFEAAERCLDVFRKMKFDIEPFGRNSVLMRAVPHIAHGARPKELFMDILSELMSFGSSAATDAVADKIRALLACHGAARAGDELTHKEAVNLLSDLAAGENPATCPHGRPTMIEFSREELEKMFKRR